MAELYSLLFKIVLSLGLGGLIGLERERAHKGYPAGVRTLAFISLLGSLTSLLSEITENSMIYPFSIATIFLFMGASYVFSIRKKSFGLTSTIILLLTYFIGLISYFEEYQYIAVSVAILATLILTSKETLHKFARKMKTSELLDSLKFAIVAFIILPLLPNTTIDPFNVINPYTTWLMVVLILGISFIGYSASKIIGSSRGIYVSGAIGGMVSSTAVTSSLSTAGRKDKSLTTACSVGITLASSVMFIRLLLETYIVNTLLFYELLIPLMVSTIAGFSASYFMIKKRKEQTPAELIKSSPFDFIPAIKFTVFLTIILLVSRISLELIGERGAYVTGFFAGLIDTDAVTLSMASLAGETISYSTAKNAVLIACITNTLTKLFLAKTLGSKELFKKLLISFSAILAPLLLFTLLSF